MNDKQRAKIIGEAAALIADDPEKADEIRKSSEVVKPLLDQLVELGYKVKSLSDLRHQRKPWKTALPILLSWLSNGDDLSVKEDIVRCLSVPWVGNKATAELIEEFRKYAWTVFEFSCLHWWYENSIAEGTKITHHAQI